DVGNGRPLAIVDDAAGPRRRPELQEVQADPVVVGPEEVVGADPGCAGLVGDKPAQGVARQPGHPRRGTAESSQAHRRIEFRPTAVWSSAPPTRASRLWACSRRPKWGGLNRTIASPKVITSNGIASALRSTSFLV